VSSESLVTPSAEPVPGVHPMIAFEGVRKSFGDTVVLSGSIARWPPASTSR
jgi:hypothetical protein